MEAMERFGRTPDLFYAVNNGVLAIWPTRDGKLKSLLLTTKRGVERSWVFTDYGHITDKDGDEIVNHHVRGAACGSWADGQNFIKMCTHEFSLAVKTNGYSGNGVGFVPLSNGQRLLRLRSAKAGGEEACCDWDPAELKRVRVDLPTHIEILAVLGKKE